MGLASGDEKDAEEKTPGIKPLRRIAFNDRAGLIKELTPESLQQASAVLERNERSRAALVAYRARDRAKLESILKTDIDLDIRDAKGDCLLHYAIQCQDVAMVDRLLRLGADISITDPYGRTPLIAAISRCEEIALLLIDADDDLSRHWKDGAHALHIAAKQWDGMHIVEKLLARGVDPQIADTNGETPLAHALRGRRQSVEPLCVAGATGGMTGDEMAAHVRLMEGEKEEHYHWDLAAIMARTAEKDAEVLKQEFPTAAAGMEKPMNALDAELFEALRHSSPAIGPIIKKGASLRARNAEGDTPLIYALKQNRDQYCIEYLLKEGSDVNAENKWGMTPLHYAVGIVEGVIARMLLDRGAWPDAQDKVYGRTPLMMACAKGGNHMDLLLKRGADPRIRDRMSWNGHDIAVLHRNRWSSDIMEKALKKAETDPPKTIPKPVKQPADNYGLYRGYRPGFWF